MRRNAPGIAHLEAASLQLFGMGIGRANDDPRFSHGDMLRSFDRAIAMAAGAANRRDQPSETLSGLRSRSRPSAYEPFVRDRGNQGHRADDARARNGFAGKN
jgi:hypothetical protein